MSKDLYVIDGHSQIYAAYYAPTGGAFTAPSGEPTKATFIFITMLLKLLKERRPTHWVMAMDSPEPCFRHRLSPAYKANRPPMPEDLIRQIQRIEQVLQALRIPLIRLPGYEADDVIGALARLAGRRGYHCFLCSKDKDLEQLLSERVSLYDPRSGELLDPPGLLEKKGLRPDQVIDVLTLEGDTSDNVPGVPDVGPKTALQWIQKYGTLDGVLAHRDEIGGKRGENLRACLEQLELSRQLVTIDCRAPIEPDWQAMRVQPFDRPALEHIFGQLGFKRLLEQLAEVAALVGEDRSGAAETPAAGPPGELPFAAEPPPKTPATAASGARAPADHRLVDTPQAFEKFHRELSRQRAFAVDTETTSLNAVAAELVGLSFCWQAGVAYYLPLQAPLGQRRLDRAATLERLRPILTDPQVAKVGQNIKYDSVILRRAGIELAGVAFDTMVASYVLHPERSRHNLDSLALDFLGHDTIKLESLLGRGKGQLTFDQVDTPLAADYSAEDAEVTWRLYELFSRRFTDDDRRRLFQNVEMPLVEVLAELEYNGVALDVPVLKKLETQLGARLDELVGEIHRAAGCPFNVDSPKQLAEVLFDKLHLTPLKKTKSGRSTDQEVLESLAWRHPAPRLMLEYRQLSKLKGTYVGKLPAMICPATGRLHASFNQTITATGRLSSSDPNLQNIPVRSALGQEIRRAFVAGLPGHVLLAADYSQIELRLLAHLSGDAGLREAFAAAQDIHRFVAAQVFGVRLDQVTAEQRRKAKAVNFGIIYGQTPYGLSRAIGASVDDAKRFIDDYFTRYPKIVRFINETIAAAARQGYVTTLLGRRRPLPDLQSSNRAARQLAERMAVNTVVQGAAADMIKVAMVRLFRRLRRENLPLKMILQVHDELVFEVPRKAARDLAEIVRHEMADALPLDVPVTVDVGAGPNWLECK